MKSEQLIQLQIEQIRDIINQIEKLKNYDLHLLTWKENRETWSILECLEHLNLYGDYYLPQIELKISKSNTHHNPNFKSGLLGNYFAKSMLPKEKLNKMKTFKDKNPLNAALDISVLDRCLAQQIKMLELLNSSRKVNLNNVKIETSISKWIRINLGDTFQFIINHIIRHLNQINRIEQKLKQNGN